MAGAAAHLHGWGYQGRTVEDLVQFARAHDVTTVVDIRLTPLSRKRGFSRRALESALSAAGLGYLHLPALGNPRDNRGAFARVHTDEGVEARSRFLNEVLSAESAREALATLQNLAESVDVVVLCFEADEDLCHRQLVIRALEARLQRAVA